MIDKSMSIRVLTRNDLIDSGCNDYKKAIKVVEETFVKYANNDVIFPDKVSVVFDEKEQNRINCLPAAIISEQVYGMKWVSVYPNNPKKFNKENLTALYILSDLKTGYPLTVMEGSMCSNMRTAAVGAVAAKHLANPDSTTIGFIGAGEQAKSHLLAFLEVLPNLKVCKVSSRTNESVKLFISEMEQYAKEIEFINCSNDYESAAVNSDIIVTAISGQEEILKANWIKEGCFYCHVAGLEDEFAVAKKADKIVCDKWETVKHRTQTISRMYQQGIINDNDIYADLHEIIIGNKAGRESQNEFIYFNSVGLSFVDTSLAYWMYSKCLKDDNGMTIEMK